jgi:hypothetical protein
LILAFDPGLKCVTIRPAKEGQLMRSRNANAVRVILPLAVIALLHAFGRYIFDPRPVDGFLLRPLLAIWFTGLGATYALTWVGHDLGRRLLLVWGILSSVGFLADNIGILSTTPTPLEVVPWNWLGVGLGISLAVMAYSTRNLAN